MILAEKQFFDSNGIKIHFDDQGSGDPVVLMHGFAGNHQLHWFDTEIAQVLLDSGYRVLAPDARAHGLSDRPHDPSLYGAHMAMDIANLLAHVGLERAHVVGYSMGSAIGAKLRELHPDKLVTLTLGANGWDKQMKPDSNLVALADHLDEGGDLLPLFQFLYPEKTEQELKAHTASRMARLPDMKAVAAYFRSAGLGITEESIRTNTVPTLAIVGARDPLKARADLLDGVMPHFEKVVIPDADHGTSLTHPMFTGALTGFLSLYSSKES